MKIKCLPQEGLKLIACITMLIDHVGYLFFPSQVIFRLIGRIAFPLYCFLLTQGVRRTRSKSKYLLRLVLIAALSEIAFDLLFYGRLTLAKQSVMVTLLLGICMCVIMEKLPWLPLKALVFIPFYYLASYARCDYGWRGVAMIALFYLSEELPWKQWIRLAGLVVISFCYSRNLSLFGFMVPMQLACTAAMIPIALYDGRKLTHHPTVQWSFNLFYPVHLALLWVIRMLPSWINS